MRRARTEDALERAGGIASWVHAQDIASSTMQPRDYDDLVASPDAPETFEYMGLENEPGLRSAFVSLPGRRCGIG
jgi:hypothetical protein